MDFRGRIDYFIGKALVHFLLFFKKLFPPDPQCLGSKMAKQGSLSKETILAQMNETLEFLKELGVEVTNEPRVVELKSSVEDVPDEFGLTIDLPFRENSDYLFRLYIYTFGQHEICANLLDKETGKPLGVCFWGHAIEVWDRGYYSFEELRTDFHETLRLVVENETRVIQQDMDKVWNFTFEALVDGEWKSVPGSGIEFKDSGLKFPEIDSLVKVYYSKPLASKRK